MKMLKLGRPILVVSLAIMFVMLNRSVVGQNTWLVPQQFSNIQLAINAASHGDTVLVSPGT